MPSVPTRISLDEFLGAQYRQRRVEAQHDRAVEPGGGQEPQLVALVGQPEQRLLRAEEAARMRLEGQRRRRPAERARALPRGRDHGPVAAVDAVEIADGDHRAAQRMAGRGGAAGHAEGRYRLRTLGHGSCVRLTLPTLVFSAALGGRRAVLNRYDSAQEFGRTEVVWHARREQLTGYSTAFARGERGTARLALGAGF